MRDEKEWTILIYQAGDNNLSEECVYALKEMKKVGTFDKGQEPNFHVMVQFDPSGRGNKARRFRIGEAGGDGTIEDDKVFEFEKEIDTGDPQTLIDFLVYGIKKCPAKHYILVLSGHGAGIMEGFFLQDEERPYSLIPSSLPIIQMRTVFANDDLRIALNGRKINILGFDACMMSMVEVCYELRDSQVLDFIIGSEGFSLNSGWPLEAFLKKLKESAVQTPEDLADFIVTKYAQFYTDYHLGGLSVDQSIIKLAKVTELRRVVDDLAHALVGAFEKESPGKDEAYDPNGRPFQDAILLSHWAAQSYNGEQCIDLYDFCELLQRRFDDREVHTNQRERSVWWCCQRVMDAIGPGREAVVTKTCTAGSAFQFSRGVSIYFPWAAFDLASSYQKLAFAQDSAWLRFLEVYLKKTQRPPVGMAEFRSTPPTSKGPEGRIHTMRNPPTEFPKKHCVAAS